MNVLEQAVECDRLNRLVDQYRRHFLGACEDRDRAIERGKTLEVEARALRGRNDNQRQLLESYRRRIAELEANTAALESQARGLRDRLADHEATVASNARQAATIGDLIARNDALHRTNQDLRAHIKHLESARDDLRDQRDAARRVVDRQMAEIDGLMKARVVIVLPPVPA